MRRYKSFMKNTVSDNSSWLQKPKLKTNIQGSVIRIAPNLLSFTDPLLLPKVYHRAAEKTPFYSTGLAGEAPPLLQIESHSQHAAKLKIIAPTVSLFNATQAVFICWLFVVFDEKSETLRMCHRRAHYDGEPNAEVGACSYRPQSRPFWVDEVR